MFATTTAPAVEVVPAWAPVALTPRGTAACRLSDFQDAWTELTLEDRRWFAEWLTSLLVDACQEPAATR
jgi:hypothetical protein